MPYSNSVTGKARNPFEKGKLLGVLAITAPSFTCDFPTTSRTKFRFTVSPTSGSSVHFASNSSSRPPTSTTKSTSRVRSRQKKRLPARPFDARGHAIERTRMSPRLAPDGGRLVSRSSTVRMLSSAQSRPVSAKKSFWTLHDGFGAIREPGFQQGQSVPDASNMDSQWLAVVGEMPTSRARSALFSRFAERNAHARINRSKSRRLPTLASKRISRSR